MSAQTITPELVAPEQDAQLVAVIEQQHLPAPVAATLNESFAPLFAKAREIIEQSRGVTVTDASQKLEIKLARECRLALRAVRVEGEHTRKSLKDQSLRECRAIDGFQAILLQLTATEEERLDAQEKFVERKEAERKAALRVERESICLTAGLNPLLYQLADMDQATFDQLVEGQRLANAAKEAARKAAEAERIAKEAADRIERQRIADENARLKREADEREAAAKIERERVEKEKAEAARAAKAELDRREALAAEERRNHEAAAAEIRRLAKEAADKAKAEADRKAAAVAEAARKERLRLQAIADVERQKTEAARAAAESEAHRQRVAREQLEQAAKEAQAKEAARVAAEQEAARKAAAAPDKDKLITYANAVRALELPEFSTNSAKSLAATIAAQREKFATWIEEKAGAL